jgi:hypothetical protein
MILGNIYERYSGGDYSRTGTLRALRSDR